MNKQPIDDVSIAKLVDGELDHSTRSQWLASLPDDSPIWRSVALSFVENQMLDEALSSVSESAQPMGPNVPRFVGANERSSKPTRNRSGRIRFLAIAAGLCVCLLGGFLVGSNRTKNFATDATRIPVGSHPDRTTDLQTDSVRSNDSDSVELSDALARSVIPIPSKFRHALLKSGYSVSDVSRITEVKLPTGSSIKMPIRQVDIHYVGLNGIQ